ncbi:MAG: TolC family protein, partial [Verrucomicrobiota bacterium]
MSIFRLLFVSLISFLVGCVAYQDRPISPAEMALSFEARTLNNPVLRSFLEKNSGTNFSIWPLRSWDFSTLTLVAFYYHPSLDVARAQWAVSNAGETTAKARPNPTVSVSPEYNFNAASGVSPWIAGLNFDLPIETAGKRGYRMAQAKHLSEAARLNIGTVAWQVRKNLRDSLVDFGVGTEKESLLKKQRDTQTKIVGILEQQLKAGAIAPIEISTVRLALNKIQIDLGLAHSQSVEARSRVAEAMGLPSAAIAGIDFNSAPATASDLFSPEVRRQALQNRSDILSSLAEYAASQSALQLEIAKQYPDVHLGTGYQFDQGENKWALVGLSLELPVLNRNQGGIAEAKARREEAVAKFTALQAKVMAEVDRALAGYEAAQEQLKLSKSLLETQHQREQSIEAQFKAGSIERMELL